MSDVPGHQTMTSPPLVRIESGSVGSGETLNVHKRGYDEEQVISMSEIELNRTGFFVYIKSGRVQKKINRIFY